MGADFYSKRIPNPVFGLKSDDVAHVGLNQEEGGSLSGASSFVSSRNSSGSLQDIRTSDSASSSSLRGGGQKQEPPTQWDQSLTGERALMLQIFDTAGRERFVMDGKSGLSSTFGDAFFDHADAAILVYDATSSRSFSQLLQWYSELMERMKPKKEYGKDGSRRQSDSFPVLVVANKLDIIEAREEANKPMRRRIVPQRSVLKLKQGFRGKDHRYEYTVSSSPPPSKTDEKQKENIHQHNSLSYGLTDTLWTTDNSYLNSVIKSEDSSFPDREMVVLWCMRNGLQHTEVSALDGTGVDECVSKMVRLVLESMNKKEKEKKKIIKTDEEILAAYWESRCLVQSLDLHERYSPKEDTRCCMPLMPWCSKSCQR